MEEVKVPNDIVSHVADLIVSGNEGADVIKLHYLESEEDQHDDNLIDSIVRVFSVTLKELASKLDEKYGKHVFTDDSDENFEEEDEDEFYVPGSYVSAIWEHESFNIYLAVCQMDREYPITLVVGVEY